LFSTSENTAKTQIGIAMRVYVHLVIVEKKLCVKRRVCAILRVLRLKRFEKTTLFQSL